MLMMLFRPCGFCRCKLGPQAHQVLLMLMMLGPVFLQMQIGASGPPGPADADDARPCVSAKLGPWAPQALLMLMILGLVFLQMHIGASGPPGPADADDARPCVLQIGAEAVLILMMHGLVFYR